MSRARLMMMVATVVLAATATWSLPPSIDGAMASAPAPSAGFGWARFGHFAPSVDAVDVVVDGQPFAAGVAFKTVSDYVALPAGVHTFQLRPAGQPSAPVLFEAQAGVPDGGSVTVAGVTTRDGVAAQVYDDALVMPEPGQALVRFIHASPEVAAVDVVVTGGPVLASNVPYPSASGYVPIAPGLYDVEVRAAGSADVLLRVAGWSIEPGVQASIIILQGLDGSIDVAPVRDAAAVAVPPSGGVQTGFGSMAPHVAEVASGTPAVVMLLVVGLIAVGLIAVGSFIGAGRVLARRRVATIGR